MVKIFKALSSALSVTVFYVLSVFIAPIILLVFGQQNLESNPKIFGFQLYNIEVFDTTFSTEITTFGLFISFLMGIVIHYLITLLFKLKKTSSIS